MIDEKVGKLMVLKAPFGGYEQVGRRLANESLQHDILPYVLNVSRDKINILVGRV